MKRTTRRRKRRNQRINRIGPNGTKNRSGEGLFSVEDINEIPAMLQRVGITGII